MGEQRTLRIAILLDKFLPSRGGERYFSFLCKELAHRGHDVHVFATEVEEKAGGPFHIHLIPVCTFPRSLRLLSFLRNSRRSIEAGRFDIVHGIAPCLAVNVYNPHGGVEQAYLRQEFRSMNSGTYRLYRRLRRYLSPRHYLEVWAQKRLYRKGQVMKTIAISRMVKSDLITHYGVDEQDIPVVFNSVDLERFNPENSRIYRAGKRAELGIGESEVVLLFAGNNYRLKGMETLLRAMALLQERPSGRLLRLLVAGRSRRGRYEKLARKLGVSDRVSFLGPVSGMEHYYAASDIYVHPTFYDSCSLTVLEALASGLPAVTSRFNGAADAIASRKGGWVIDDPGDPGELAEAIAFYLDEQRRVEARAEARSWMERCRPSRNVEETLQVYYQAVERAAGTQRGQGTAT